MAFRIRLESFENGEKTDERLELDQAEFEEIKLAAFEKGYSAGWEDAVSAQNAETKRLHADLGKNLQELGFTYNEARAHLLNALKPLLLDMTAKVLPRIAQTSLPQIVIEELMEIADEMAQAPITIIANPAAAAQVQEILERDTPIPVGFKVDPTLGDGQVDLRFDQMERRIDLGSVVARIDNAVKAYFVSNNEEIKDADA